MSLLIFAKKVILVTGIVSVPYVCAVPVPSENKGSPVHREQQMVGRLTESGAADAHESGAHGTADAHESGDVIVGEEAVGFAEV